MADEKQSKKEKAVKKAKTPGNNKIARFFKDYKSELKKIVWPTKEDTLKKSWVVAVALVVSGAIIGAISWAFLKLILFLGSIF